MKIHQLIERLIAIYVINPDADIYIENEASRIEVETVFYDKEDGVFLINGDDQS